MYKQPKGNVAGNINKSVLRSLTQSANVLGSVYNEYKEVWDGVKRDEDATLEKIDEEIERSNATATAAETTTMTPPTTNATVNPSSGPAESRTYMTSKPMIFHQYQLVTLPGESLHTS